MINVFETSFEARERRFQIEKLYHGETVDLVGTITTDGVLKNITGYTVQGVFQPTTAQGSDQFYELSADIVDNKVVVHWEKGKDFGEPSYMVWALLTDGDDASYPITWRLDMAYSPNFPLSALDPIPKAIDFSKYELLNAPWLELSAVGDLPYIPLSVENSLPYVALSGGTVNSGFSLKSNGNTILGGLNDSPAIGIFSTATGFSTAVGYNAKATARYSTAVGSVTKTTGENATAVGYGAKALSAKSTAVGGDSTAGGVGSIAVGYGAVTGGQNAVAVGFGSRANADNSMQIGYGTNNVSNSLKVLGKMVLSGDNLTLDPERVPYLSNYAEKEELTAYAQLSDVPVLPDDLVHEDELSDYAQLSDIPELPEDIVRKDDLSVYAQLSDLENIDIDGMSACLSSDEFADVEELGAAETVSFQDLVDKVNLVIQKLKRTWKDPRKTYFKYSDGSEIGLALSGTLNRSDVPNRSELTEAIIGTDITDIGSQAFRRVEGSDINSSKLTAVYVPGSVKTIGYQAFSYAFKQPSTITLSEGLTAFTGSEVFESCGGLASIVLPQSIQSLYVASLGSFGGTVTFTGKTTAEVSAMRFFRWGASSGKIVCTDGTL